MLSKQISTRLTRLSHLSLLSIFMTVKAGLLMDLHPFCERRCHAATEQGRLSWALLKFTFPVSSFVLSCSFKSSSVYPVWISAGFHRHSFGRSRNSFFPVGLQRQAMIPNTSSKQRSDPEWTMWHPTPSSYLSY